MHSCVIPAYSQNENLAKWIIGGVLAVLFFVCISGGGKQIAGITEKIVPFMGFFYIAVAVFVIVTHITLLPGVFAEIFRNAFDVKAIFRRIYGVCGHAWYQERSFL